MDELCSCFAKCSQLLKLQLKSKVRCDFTDLSLPTNSVCDFLQMNVLINWEKINHFLIRWFADKFADHISPCEHRRRKTAILHPNQHLSRKTEPAERNAIIDTVSVSLA